MVFHQLANLLFASLLLTILVPIKQCDGKNFGPTTTPAPTRCQNTKADALCNTLANFLCQASCHRCHITGASPCRDQYPEDCPEVVKDCPSVCNDKCWPASTTTIANNSSAATTLPPEPLPSCPKCPLCHNHCEWVEQLCEEPDCILVDRNNESVKKCSFGCVEGLCPRQGVLTRPSYNILMADPCKKCDGQSRCENSGICHTLPSNATQDEKFVCDCPEPFHGKYCGRWGGNQFVLSQVGKNCKNSIRNESVCRESAKLLKDVTYATLSDGGNDLPYGCILDKTDKDNNYVFWNSNGSVRSADIKVREICSITEDPLEGLECENDYGKSKSEIQNRIRESEDSCQVKPHSKPWIVRLKIFDTGLCGGTLISTKTVITAAHCTCTGKLRTGNLICNMWKNTTLIIGDHYRSGNDCNDTLDNAQCFGIKYGEQHKNWTGDALDGYDVALFSLDRKVILNQNVQIAQLPELDAPCPNGMNLVASGWGTYPEWGNIVPFLDHRPVQLVKLQHKFLWAVKQKCVDMENCNKHVAEYNVTVNPDSVMCVVGPGSGGIDGPYFGDSGGPLTYTKNGITTLYGVTSFLFNVIDRNHLGTTGLADESGFARVSNPDIIEWINEFKQKYENDEDETKFK